MSHSKTGTSKLKGNSNELKWIRKVSDFNESGAVTSTDHKESENVGSKRFCWSTDDRNAKHFNSRFFQSLKCSLDEGPNDRDLARTKPQKYVHKPFYKDRRQHSHLKSIAPVEKIFKIN